jgi:predicted phosphodiesterase
MNFTGVAAFGRKPPFIRAVCGALHRYAAVTATLLLSIIPLLAQQPFVFTITADSHLDYNTDRALYERTLKRAAADKPAFHIDLGDTFMSEKHTNRADAAQQYVDQQRYFALLGTPVHLVIGNHDGESGRYLDGTTNNLAVWSRAMRMKYFPESLAPDGRNYYSWETNNVLCVALDPFWYSPRSRRNDDNWSRTLGREQYDWLKHTLETSKANFKFVFIHHLVGGKDRQCRGGVEIASLYEWGGKNADGTDGFATHRPGWAMPIHELLVTNHVNAVFHGHDHLYVKQDLDGIVYQECPQPGDPRGNTRSAAEYGYQSGKILGSSGYLRVTVGTDSGTVEYVKTARTGEPVIADSYPLRAR